MITEPTSASAPPEVLQNIETVNSQVETLARELSQAMEVWQTTLAEEKARFDELLSHKDLAAQEQDGQWESQSQAFETRIAEMKTEFDSRLSQMEQNAARALAELDDAWQHDKLEWGPAAQSDWPTQRRTLETKVKMLEEELAQVKSVSANAPSPETVKALQGQLIEFQESVALLQDRASRSDDLLNACVQALDYQISVLYDLVQHHVSATSGEDNRLAQS